MASFIYILNDIKDRELDKNHPIKSKRPLVSGKISVQTACFIALFLLICGFLGLSFLNTTVVLSTLFYLVLNLLYIYVLKNYALIDIITISIGYLIRLFIGASVAGVELSNWIIIMTFLLALFLAASKRYDDLQYKNKEQLRQNINGYNPIFIENTMSILTAIIVVAYILYTTSPAVIEQYNCKYLYATALFVIVGILRYLQIVFVFKKSDSPTNIVFKDKFLKYTIILWSISYLWIIYL